ncbi:uncharacterized protein LOC143910002 [Arctopsyche grandis]|uniref:uncharacterized protein LOC143910002 n=1 Tax=Arctopsyche grandis TaxID=121162 RepID=UPI00406D67C3
MECRLCLRHITPESSVSIYESSDSVDATERIWSCCHIQVKRQDGLPDTICLSCESNLRLLTNFKKTCLQSEARQGSKECSDIKIEEILLDDFILPYSFNDDDDGNTSQSNSSSPRQQIPSIDECEEKHSEVSFQNTSYPAGSSARISKREKLQRMRSRKLISTKVIENVKNVDPFDVFGHRIVSKMRDLPYLQKIICEKLIGEAIFMAQLGILTVDTKIVFGDTRNKPGNNRCSKSEVIETFE